FRSGKQNSFHFLSLFQFIGQRDRRENMSTRSAIRNQDSHFPSLFKGGGRGGSSLRARTSPCPLLIKEWESNVLRNIHQQSDTDHVHQHRRPSRADERQRQTLCRQQSNHHAHINECR